MDRIQKAFKDAGQELMEATLAKENFELEYVLKEAQKMFSDEVSSLGNQTLRDAQLKLLMKDDYKKLVGLRTDAKVAYFKWATLKTLSGGDR